MAVNQGAVTAVKGAGASWAGMPEAIAFLSYMSSREKNPAIRKSYVIATKDYRRALKVATPVQKETRISGVRDLRKRTTRQAARGKLGKKRGSLKQSVGIAKSRKHKNKGDLIDPIWAGHLVKKGAFAQHFIVLGTPAIVQNGSSLHRGAGRRKKTMRFSLKGGTVHTKLRKAKAANHYVNPIAAKYKGIILSQFGDSFILAMKKHARKRYPEYFK